MDRADAGTQWLELNILECLGQARTVLMRAMEDDFCPEEASILAEAWRDLATAWGEQLEEIEPDAEEDDEEDGPAVREAERVLSHRV